MPGACDDLPRESGSHRCGTSNVVASNRWLAPQHESLMPQLNASEQNGRTALHVAADNRHVDTCRVLLTELGADVSAVDQACTVLCGTIMTPYHDVCSAWWATRMETYRCVSLSASDITRFAKCLYLTMRLLRPWPAG